MLKKVQGLGFQDKSDWQQSTRLIKMDCPMLPGFYRRFSLFGAVCKFISLPSAIASQLWHNQNKVGYLCIGFHFAWADHYSTFGYQD